jgi:hypothetical protein
MLQKGPPGGNLKRCEVASRDLASEYSVPVLLIHFLSEKPPAKAAAARGLGNTLAAQAQSG